VRERSVAQAELYTAVNVYLLLGLLWAAIYLAIDAFLSGFNPDWKSLSRPSDRAALFQPDNALYRRIRRYRAAQRNGPHITALEGVTGFST
jgi:hypothetical protein